MFDILFICLKCSKKMRVLSPLSFQNPRNTVLNLGPTHERTLTQQQPIILFGAKTCKTNQVFFYFDAVASLLLIFLPPLPLPSSIPHILQPSVTLEAMLRITSSFLPCEWRTQKTEGTSSIFGSKSGLRVVNLENNTHNFLYFIFVVLNFLFFSRLTVYLLIRADY